MSTLFNRIRKAIETLLIASLLAMVALTFADVIGRRFFGTPIYGAHDLTEHLMTLLVFSGLPLLTSARGHLVVDLFDRFVMTDSMRWWRGLTTLLVAAILLLIAYQFVLAALDAEDIQEVSQELLIPRSYFYYLISLSCLVSAIAALLPPQKTEPHTQEDAS
jgi:TRAP-type C4-dicarboxylate transport system permease small subunit